MTSVHAICDALLRKMGHAVSTPVSPDALARWLRLELEPISFGRNRLTGNRIHYNDCAPPAAQAYHIARGACAFALIQMGLIRDLSPHDLALALCGVSSLDTQATDGEPALPPVRYIHAKRARKRGDE